MSGRAQYFVALCRECGATYDMDFDPPLFCHDDPSWTVWSILASDIGPEGHIVNAANREAAQEIARKLYLEAVEAGEMR